LALFSVLLVASGIPAAYAWNLSVSPGSRSVAPGQTVSFGVTVSGSIAGDPNVQLIVSPPVLGISASFSKNNVPAPFTSTMIVSVDPSKAPGTYDLPLWAHPANELFPGPGNKAVNVHLIVGAGFDFSLQLSPYSVSVRQGETARYQILITYSDPSYSGTSITVQVTGLGPGMDYQVVPSPPSLNIMTSQSTPPGTYAIALVGSAMGVSHHTEAILVVQPAEQPFDFSISASPTQQTITPGASTTCTITVSLASGTSQNVVLTVSAPSGISASLNPTSGAPSFNSILTISAAPSMAPSQYVVTITGNAGAKTHAVTIALTIGQSPDFRIEASPQSQTSSQGHETSYSLRVVGLNGFNSEVFLNVAGLPAGVTSVFSVSSSFPDYSSTLTVTIPSNSPTGSFTLSITGSGGGISRVANVILIINPSETQSQTTTQTGPSLATGVLETLQENSLIIIAALALLVILFAALLMRGRGHGTVPQQKAASRIFCGKCGAENPASNQFCVTCGQKLKSN
jgi:hypothetical protein